MSAGFLLVLVSLGAFLLPILGERIGVPSVVLEIVYGILLGPSVAGLAASGGLLSDLATIGFFLLFFLGGFEIDLDDLWSEGPRELLAAVASLTITIGLSYLSARLVGYGWFVALMLATTSVAIVLPTLVISGKAGRPLGRSILIAAIFADFVTLLGATLVAIYEQSDRGTSVLRVPFLFLAAAGLLAYLRRLEKIAPHRVRRLEQEEDPKELGIRAALAGMLFFAGLAEVLGVEPILGAFLAGLVFSFGLKNEDALRRKLSSFAYGFLIPVFFIDVGIGFRVGVLVERGIWADVLWLLGAAVLVKVVPAFIYRFRGLSTREVLAMGALMSARLSLIIAVAELGVEIGILSRTVEEAVVVVALVTTTLAPVIFARLTNEEPSAIDAAAVEPDSPRPD